MKQCVAEWHLKPDLKDARRIREELTAVLNEHTAEDVSAFQLACAELIVNLSRYPTPKPTEVSLTLSKDPQFWWLELRDNGPSFNQFSQLMNNSDPLEAAESGMGLKLLAQLFSDIRYIPACYREDGCNLMQLKQPICKTDSEQSTLLIVDDDPSFRAIIRAYLADDYQLIEADSVANAFTAILDYHPALVICDIQMPEQDGPALFDQISHIPEVANTAFIYLSGCSDPDKIALALKRPIDDFITKPTNRDELLAAISRVLQRRSYLDHQIRNELEEKVTLGLHPSLPEDVDGYKLQLRSINPEPGGGDLVQLQQDGAQNLIVMADLLGHGLSAKGYSYALAGYLKGLSAAAFSQQIDLGQLFDLLSDSFQSDPVLKETLATLIAARLDNSGNIEWVNAGQPLPLHLTEKQIIPIEAHGALPGLGLDNYSIVSTVLVKGDRVLIYSDGFNDSGLALPDELIVAIQESQILPISAAADHLLMQRLKMGKSEDDLTLILIEKS